MSDNKDLANLETKVTAWSNLSRSLRTTIPAAVVQLLNLQSMDVLVWNIQVEKESQGDSIRIIVSKKVEGN